MQPMRNSKIIYAYSMFHALVKKLKALCALVFDSKIIFISCTYVLVTIILIPILRNSSHHPGISLLCGCFVVGIVLLIVINRLRNILEISNTSRKKKNVCSKLLYLFDIFVYSVTISIICAARLTSLISLEKQA